MTRILLCTKRAMGGDGLYVANLAKALADLGQGEVHLLTSSNTEKSIGNILNQSDVRLHRDLALGKVSAATVRDYLRWHLANYRHLYRLLKRIRFDIIHLQFGLHFTDWIVPMIGRRLGVPVLMTVHDVTPHRWTFQKLSRLERWVLRKRYGTFSHLIVHTHEGRQELVQDYGIEGAKATVIPHAIECNDIVLPAERNRSICLIGGLRRNKGIVQGIEGFQILMEDAKEEWTLVIRGKAQDGQFLGEIEAAIAQAPDAIDFREGYLEEGEFRAILSRAMFCLLPYTEFHSQSGVAAMAIGYCVPCIAVGAGGLSELVADGKTGFLIEDGSREGIARAIGQAISSLGTYPGMVANLQLVRNRYSWPTIARTHLQTYEKVVRDAK